MLPRNHPDGIRVAFDDHRLVAHAGLLLPASLALRLGLGELADQHVDLGDAPGRRANPGDKLLTLVASALAGGDCIDDADALRSGSTGRVLGCVVKAPSTLGTFLRSFRWGHVRQLDRVSRELLSRAWAAGGRTRRRAADHRPGFHHLRDLRPDQGGGPLPRLHRPAGLSPAAGRCRRNRRHPDGPSPGGPGQHRPGSGPLPAGGAGPGALCRGQGPITVRADSGFYAHSIVAVCRRMKVRFSITVRQHSRLSSLIEAIPEAEWRPIPYWMEGAADVAEAEYTPFQSEPDAAPVRLIVRRVKPTPGSQLALFASYSYHAFITDRDGDVLELEADHRRHAEIENAIRDLKYGVGLNHLPSGRFCANAAWLAAQVMARNLARWTGRIALSEPVATTKTLRRRILSLTGRLTRKVRRLTLHLPHGRPWEAQFSSSLARLQALPLPS